MKTRLPIIASVFSVLLLLLGSGVGAQEQLASNMDILRDKLAADKKLMVAENLILTESEASAFWPMYEDYQQELEAINQRLARLILDYADAYNAAALISDAKAKELLTEALAIEEAEVALRKTYAERMDEVVPTVEVARYLQMENKIRAVVKFDIAAEIPLAY